MSILQTCPPWPVDELRSGVSPLTSWPEPGTSLQPGEETGVEDTVRVIRQTPMV